MNIIDAKWVYSWKGDSDGRVVGPKARLCARGFRQRAGIDFFETFSPCPNVSSTRLLSAITCSLGKGLFHLDVSQAFVQSELDEVVYIRLPRNCGALSGKVLRLGRSLYGLKQASRTWHKKLVSVMKLLGFQQCPSDNCVMRLVSNGVLEMAVVVHVDDILAAGDRERCERFGRDLNEHFPVKFLGELEMYAGVRFTRDPVSGNLTLSQQAFAENLVRKFGVNRSKPTPMAVGVMLASFVGDEVIDVTPFRSLIGHLMWLANQTRPDILNAVRALARYCNAPTMGHWKAALHVLMYVRGTINIGITFERGGSLDLVLYVDADFASKETGRKSVSGGLLMCASACAGYFSKTQQSVTTATSEAEYAAMAQGLKEMIFMRYVWSFILLDRDVGCTTVYEDNEGARYLAINPATTPNSKHIDIRHHFIRERVEREEFKIVHVMSRFQHADFLTKPLHQGAFFFHRKFAMNL